MAREPDGNAVGDHMAMPSEPMAICICILWQRMYTYMYICTLDRSICIYQMYMYICTIDHMAIRDIAGHHAPLQRAAQRIVAAPTPDFEFGRMFFEYFVC